MAAVEITISGVLYDKYNRTQQNVVLIGEASITGLQVGGGPIIPPGQPPGIWGPPGPWPTPPIAFPPGWVGGQPPGIWGPPGPWPTPPIANVPGLPPNPDPPKPPEGPPDENGFIKAPPPEGGWGYHQDYGWMYMPGGQSPGPKGA